MVPSHCPPYAGLLFPTRDASFGPSGEHGWVRASGILRALFARPGVPVKPESSLESGGRRRRALSSKKFEPPLPFRAGVPGAASTSGGPSAPKPVPQIRPLPSPSAQIRKVFPLFRRRGPASLSNSSPERLKLARARLRTPPRNARAQPELPSPPSGPANPSFSVTHDSQSLRRRMDPFGLRPRIRPVDLNSSGRHQLAQRLRPVPPPPA